MWWITIKYILRPIPNVSESALFLLMTSGLFFPASFTIQAICQGPPVHFWPNKKSLDFFHQKLRRMDAPRKAFGGSKQLFSIQAATQIFIILPVTDGSDGTRGMDVSALVWSFVKERISGKGTPSKWPTNPEKLMSEDE